MTVVTYWWQISNQKNKDNQRGYSLHNGQQYNTVLLREDVYKRQLPCRPNKLPCRLGRSVWLRRGRRGRCRRRPPRRLRCRRQTLPLRSIELRSSAPFRVRAVAASRRSLPPWHTHRRSARERLLRSYHGLGSFRYRDGSRRECDARGAR